MIPARRSVRRIAILCLVLTAGEARGQGLSSSSGAALAITTPTETEYDAGASNPTGNYAITTTCTGPTSAGCRLFIQYGSNPQGQQVGLQYAIVSLTADCENAVANPNSWTDVQATLVVITTRKNRSCVAAFRFRVSPLAYDVYQSPGPPGGTYRQQAAFVLTRP
ncbi:MAG TPA: hypothetical protein VIK50_17575 [Gemmatimonadaceae bacterium]